MNCHAERDVWRISDYSAHHAVGAVSRCFSRAASAIVAGDASLMLWRAPVGVLIKQFRGLERGDDYFGYKNYGRCGKTGHTAQSFCLLHDPFILKSSKDPLRKVSQNGTIPVIDSSAESAVKWVSASQVACPVSLAKEGFCNCL